VEPTSYAAPAARGRAHAGRPPAHMLGSMAEPSKAVLITGCSSGIGRATALLLARRGWPVYATARRPETITDLADAGATTLALDVTDEESMRTAVDAVEAAEGAVGVLVNNAGYSQSGAVETVPIDAVRRQFETNVFGVVRMTQLVLPKMRAQRFGKIVNVGSMGGRLTFPGGGHYTRPSTRSRRSPTRCASSCTASAST
jgi:NAD(P)-dependent dehydrogenase (short-subunit alcohol dehydrogenase family)